MISGFHGRSFRLKLRSAGRYATVFLIRSHKTLGCVDGWQPAQIATHAHVIPLRSGRPGLRLPRQQADGVGQLLRFASHLTAAFARVPSLGSFVAFILPRKLQESATTIKKSSGSCPRSEAERDQAALPRSSKASSPGCARIKPSDASGLAACSGRDFLALSLPVAQRISSAAASPPRNAPGLIVVYAALQPQSTPGFTPAGFGRSAAAVILPRKLQEPARPGAKRNPRGG